MMRMEIHKGQAAGTDVYLVVKRCPLSEKPLLWRWLARLVYCAIGWSSDYGVEYQGVFTEEAAARHAASADGWSLTKIPLNDVLPTETCQYGVHDFPTSEASQLYRKRQLGFQVIASKHFDEQLAGLRAIESRFDELQGRCLRA